MILWQAFSIVAFLMLGGWYGESVAWRMYRLKKQGRLLKSLLPSSCVICKPICYDAVLPRKQNSEAFLGLVNINIARAVFFSGTDESKLKALIQQAVKEAMSGYRMEVSFTPDGVAVTPPALPQPKTLALPPMPEPESGIRDSKLKPGTLVKIAGPIWLKTRKPFIAANTYERKKHNLNQVMKFFGEKTLAQSADADLIREYQDKRRANAGGDCINHECQILSEMLTRVGLWKQVKDDYQPLPVKTSTAGRALSPEEEKLFVAAANSNEDWKVAYWIAVLAAHTLLSPSEIFNRQIRDLDMRNEQLLIPQGKNNFRVREVPLNKHAMNCARLLFDRAKELGAWKPDHYLLPYRVRVGEYDPTRPAKSCRSAWRALTRSIGLRGLRPKDMRHHGITVLDETKISPRVTRALAGHSPNSRLLDRYSHPRKAAKKAAVKVLENKVKLA